MATIGISFFDLIDLYKSQEKDGQIAEVIEMLSEMNTILDDAMAYECNNGTSHKHTIRTGLPSVTWGKLYKGIPNSKSGRASVEDTTGFLEARSTVDKRVLKLSSNPGAVRLSEAVAFLESLNQEAATTLFYGDSDVDPEKFTGLAPRFNSLSAANGNQIIDAGGTGADNTSIWFVTWGDNYAGLLYPKGTQAGINRVDHGEQRVLDENGDAYYAMEETFEWHLGMFVKDWRYIARIANLDVSDVAAGTVDVYKFMRKAYWQLQSRRVAGGKQCIYLNRDMLEALDALATNAGTTDNFTRLKVGEIEGKEVLTYRGIPLRETDAILNTEARVV